MYRLARRVASSSIASPSAKNNLVYGRVLSSRNFVSKDINFGVGARAAILQGVTQVADAVKVTMGPKGRNVIIERSRGNPRITKDGVTVAKSIKFKDKAKNVGADLVKQVAKATNTAAGDGTTCATVLTQAILTEGCKSVAAGVNVMDLRNGINKAVDAVITDLKSRALLISTPEEITQVGTISANGERDIGELIARAMEKVGKEGVITVIDGNTLDNELEVVEGMKLTRGYISPYFITDQKNCKCELENAFILIHDKKISDMNSLLKILELAVTKKRPLLVAAEDVESDALAMLILNKHHAGLKVSYAAVYKVGDSAGWTTLGKIDYKKWAATKNFQIGDTIIFEYNDKFHNVMQVTHAMYKSCNASSPIATFTTGNDSISITNRGHHFFFCGVPGHCEAGQKVDINVLKVSADAPTPSALASPTVQASNVPAPSPSNADPLIALKGASAMMSLAMAIILSLAFSTYV